MSIKEVSIKEYVSKKVGKSKDPKTLNNDKCPKVSEGYCLLSVDENFCRRLNTRPFKRDCSGGGFETCNLFWRSRG